MKSQWLSRVIAKEKLETEKVKKEIAIVEAEIEERLVVSLQTSHYYF